MNELNTPSRRQFLKIGAMALVALPIVGGSSFAFAAKNDAVRKALSYQTTPNDGKNCGNCKNYVPASKGCVLMPGDTEIAATGYCTGYIAKA